MIQIVWTQESENDLREIIKFISRDSVQYAYHQISKIFSRVDILRYNPEAGKRVDELKKSIREQIEGNYRIIYRLDHSGSIQRLTIHHSSRNLLNRKID